MKNQHLFSFGTPFRVGCNYWASHAGPDMWKNWDAEAVEADFAALSKAKLKTLRVFPNWRDFQPLHLYSRGRNIPKELRLGEEPLPDTPCGRAGVDPVMLERFHTFCQLASKYHLDLIVGVVTGWMSGRMFCPPAFERCRLMTDPAVVHWQVRFVRCFVKDMRNEPAIKAWDPGNECNCLEETDKETEWMWFDTIANAIRREDPSRPILTGTNSRVDSDQIPNAAEACDILCTHAYPAFSKNCYLDPIDTFRNAFQGTYMTRVCADIGRTDAMIEETGSFGPTNNHPSVTERHIGNALWNAYAHDCRGYLWWCAFDQTRLTAPPYDWSSMERELGLFSPDREPYKMVEKFTEFADFSDAHKLPMFERNAVCLVSNEQDQWNASFLSMLLAKEAGFDLAFDRLDHELPDSKLYLLPSANSDRSVPKRVYLKLLEKVANGASLYLSSDNFCPEPFAPFGIPVHTLNRPGNHQARLIGKEQGIDFTLTTDYRLKLECGTAEILAADADGDPAFCCAKYGKGKLFFLNLPLETLLAPKPGLFEPDSPPYYRIYQILAEKSGILSERRIRRNNPLVTITEHPVSETEAWCVAVNNSPEVQQTELYPASGWEIDRSEFASFENGILKLAENTGALLHLTRQN